jgi:hypothetical protein
VNGLRKRGKAFPRKAVRHSAAGLSLKEIPEGEARLQPGEQALKLDSEKAPSRKEHFRMKVTGNSAAGPYRKEGQEEEARQQPEEQELKPVPKREAPQAMSRNDNVNQWCSHATTGLHKWRTHISDMIW